MVGDRVNGGGGWGKGFNPPSSSVSVVRRIVEGMTLKSEDTRLREQRTHFPATIDMATVESPDVTSPSGSGDGHVTRGQGSHDPPRASPSYGATCGSRDDQSDRESITSSSGTPSVVEGGERGRRGRGRGKGKGRVRE